MNLADNPIAGSLQATLMRQRAAYRAHPVPSLAERRADLRTLQRFISENKQALVDAISADYGHRSAHETLLTEVGPVLSAIRHTVAPSARLDAPAAAWRRPPLPSLRNRLTAVHVSPCWVKWIRSTSPSPSKSPWPRNSPSEASAMTVAVGKSGGNCGAEATTHRDRTESMDTSEGLGR